MAELPRYQQTELYEPAQPSGAQARSLQSLSQKIAAFTEGQQRQADIYAAQEGERAGQAAAAGKIKGVEMASTATIRGKAFNKGALMAHAAAIQTDIRETTARLETTFATNMEGFQQAMESYKEGLFSQIDPMLRPYAETDINDYASRSRTRIFNATFEQQMAENLAEINKAATGQAEDAMRAYREGDLEGAATAQEKLFFTWEQGVKEGVLDQGEVDRARKVFDDEADSNWILGEFDRKLRNEGLQAANDAFEKYRASEEKDLSPDKKDQILTRMQALINAEYTRQNRETAIAKAQQEAKEKAIADQVTITKQALKAGVIPDGVDQLIVQAEGTKYYNELKTELAYARVTSEFALRKPTDQAAEISQIRAKKNPTAQELELLSRYQAINKEITTRLNEDPLTLAMEQQIVQMTAFDPTDPESMRIRLMNAEVASAHYGVAVAPITRAEAGQLNNAIANARGEEKIAIMNNMVTGFGERSIDVLEMMFKEGGGNYAVAGALLKDGRIGPAQNVLRGMDTLANNKGIIPKDFDEMIGSSIGPTYAAMPKQLKTMKNAIMALYAQKAANEGILVGGDSVDSALLEESIFEITGGILTMETNATGIFGDDQYTIEAPYWGATAADAEEWMQSITESDIKEMGGTKGIPASNVAEMINQGWVKLVSYGNGEYEVYTRAGHAIIAEDGDSFILKYGVKGTNAEVIVETPIIEAQ